VTTMSTAVAVVMAVHNGRRTVRPAIESVRAQTFTGWTMAVVDDGSSDGTAECLRAAAAADPRVVVLTNPVRRGLAASLNIAWRSVRAPLIARMDADDLSDPVRLERQVEFMAQHPQVDVVGTGARLVSPEGTLLGAATRPESHDALLACLYRESPFYHPSVMMRRSFLERVHGYDERLRRAQDQDLWFRGLEAGARYHNLPDPLITYTVSRRVSWQSAFWGAFVLLRAGWRAGRVWRGGWHAARFAAGAAVSRVRPLDVSHTTE
jgi:glycosyltransferase involved in cell wall biosynthesis